MERFRCRRRSTRSVPSPARCATRCCCTLSSRRARCRSPGAPIQALRIGVPETRCSTSSILRWRAHSKPPLDRLSRAGARIERVELPELAEVARITAGGGFAPVEAWAWHRHHLATREQDYDPRVAQRIRRGASMSAADYIDLLHATSRLDRPHDAAAAAYDVMLSPTVPIVAPPIAALMRRRRELLPAQRLAAAQSIGGQPARRLRAVAALPSSGAGAGRADGLATRHGRRRGARCVAWRSRQRSSH